MSTNQNHKISAAERAQITDAILKSATLRGLDRTKSKGGAVGEVARALESVGFSLQMVSGDILLGLHNTRLLSFTRGDEGPTIENAAINFTWDWVSGHKEMPNFEFIAYVS